jgi:GMP synthase (glutamine-hydrolysing)
MGDQQTYAYTCPIDAAHSEDGMTADWVPAPLRSPQTYQQPHRKRDTRHQPRRLDNTSKPAGTIEWE